MGPSGPPLGHTRALCIPGIAYLGAGPHILESASQMLGLGQKELWKI